MSFFRAISRLLLFIGIVILRLTLAIIHSRMYPGNPEAVLIHLRKWASHTLAFMGIEVELKGQIPTQAALIMPNHRSYIDIIFFPNFVKAACFVAKAEVRRWPLIGLGAAVVGTIFVDRNNKDSRRQTREDIKTRLAQGYSVVVFPEGTTYKTPELGVFNPGMFFAAAEGNIPVIPVAIEYEDPEDAWVGKDTFIPHFIKTFGKKSSKVKIVFGTVMTNTDGEKLLSEVRTWIEAELTQIQSEWRIKNK
ncbi:MAG: lysophospholipid acyltransferase family protein [Bacteroidia bacterium]|nr:lysophospholipid acyltransferase family protein [Bacteroidia bacterium]